LIHCMHSSSSFYLTLLLIYLSLFSLGLIFMITYRYITQCIAEWSSTPAPALITNCNNNCNNNCNSCNNNNNNNTPTSTTGNTTTTTATTTPPVALLIGVEDEEDLSADPEGREELQEYYKLCGPEWIENALVHGVRKELDDPTLKSWCEKHVPEHESIIILLVYILNQEENEECVIEMSAVGEGKCRINLN
jgi:hypothetical protein